MDGKKAGWLNPGMPPVKKPIRQRRRHFIKEWRDFRGLTQERAAERVNVSSTTWGRIEKGDVPYNQDFLEEAAYALGCEPWDLLNRDPSKAGHVVDLLDKFRELEPDEQNEALSYLEFQRSRKEAG